MIDKTVVNTIVSKWLEGKEYFLTDLSISTDNRIVVEIDHEEGVWIDDCVALSRYIEDRLDRDVEDFELEVGSAGLGQPFKVLKQYQIHEGDDVEVLTRAGKKLRGILAEVTEQGFTLMTEQKVKHEGDKRPHLEEVPVALTYEDVKYTKYCITM